MSNASTIASGKVVAIHYKLTLDDGRIIDSSEEQDPLEYLHGVGNLVSGLESELEGKSVGDQLQVTVAPEQGYGTRIEGAVQTVPRDAFPADADVQPGVMFQAMDQDQQPQVGMIVSIENEIVTVDFNHPLAGENLNFEVEVHGVREATEQEREHGHAHGPDGHGH